MCNVRGRGEENRCRGLCILVKETEQTPFFVYSVLVSH